MARLRGFYLTRKSVAVAKIDMSKPEPAGLGLDNQVLGLIDGAFLTAYALGQFFWEFAATVMARAGSFSLACLVP